MERQNIKRKDGVAIPQIRALTQSCSYIICTADIEMERKLWERRFRDWPKLGSRRQGEALRPDTY